jgi:hypothetical protein
MPLPKNDEASQYFWCPNGSFPHFIASLLVEEKPASQLTPKFLIGKGLEPV